MTVQEILLYRSMWMHSNYFQLWNVCFVVGLSYFLWNCVTLGVDFKLMDYNTLECLGCDNCICIIGDKGVWIFFFIFSWAHLVIYLRVKTTVSIFRKHSFLGLASYLYIHESYSFVKACKRSFRCFVNSLILEELWNKMSSMKHSDCSLLHHGLGLVSCA